MIYPNGRALTHKMQMGSKFIEGHIKEHESVLNDVRHLITEYGETPPEVQQIINNALDELSGWYEMREMFK